MLPKFANHLFHHTARAAATVQNYTIRNVIGLQNPSASSNGLGGWNGAGSSSWGGHGAGAGGAKYNTGSRFYGNHNGVAGRAVAQANSVTAGDSNSSQNDENDDHSPKRILRIAKQRSRLRSSSLSNAPNKRHELSERIESTKSLILLQSRAQHTHANPGLLPHSSGDVSEERTDTTPSRTRRNSTSAAAAPAIEPAPPPFPQQAPENLYELSYTNPAAPQTTRSPSPPSSRLNARPSDNLSDSSETTKWLHNAVQSNDPKIVNAEIARFRLYKEKPTLAQFDMAIKALLRVREPGTPINAILETYNEMIAHNILPNLSVYENLIVALCLREREVSQVITRLQWNARRAELLGNPPRAHDMAQIQELRDERNLASAMTIFQAMAHLSPAKTLGNLVYNYLLRACSDNANVDAAIRVYGHLEATVDGRPNTACYYHLLSTFVNAGDIKGAKDVFDEFRKAASEGRVEDRVEDRSGLTAAHSEIHHEVVIKEPQRSRSQTLLWNAMIRGYFVAKQPHNAVELFEQMLNSTAGVNFSITDVPPLSPIVYTSMIRGFMSVNDPQTAVAWFDKMLSQETPAPESPLDVLVAPIRPSQNTWDSFLEGLAEYKMLPELNKYATILSSLKEKEGLQIKRAIRLLLFDANVDYLKRSDASLTGASIREIASFLKANVFVFDGETALDVTYESTTSLVRQTLVSLTNRGYHDDALELLSVYLKGVRSASEAKKSNDDSRPIKLARDLVVGVIPSMILRQDSKNFSPLTLDFALRFAETIDIVNLFIAITKASAAYMHSYYVAKADGRSLKLSFSHWSYLAYSAAAVATPSQSSREKVVPDGFQFEGIPAFIQDMRDNNVKVSDLSSDAAQRLVSALRVSMGRDQAEEYIEQLGSEWVEVLSEVTRFSQATPGLNNRKGSDKRPYPEHIDLYHGRYVDEYCRDARLSVNTAYDRYQSGVQKGIYPPPDVIGRLISRCGREGERQKVEVLYQDAQLVLDALGEEKRLQSYGWFFVENHMIVARAALGDTEAAHKHRQAILANGGLPNADAYATLINTLKDTTDDNEHALRLWNEAQTHGVAPTLYLYNTMISQLSRARKAEMAMDLFREMKERQIHPSSVTYGAVIAACSRVGDVKSAELLFKEMTAQANFKPRVPPYNTMIQMFTNVKPDREKAIYYYKQLLASKIKPSAHTYKLLLDNYGTVQPVDLASMQKVFEDLVKDPGVQLQGTHWAALINAWGCVQKDLDKAIEIFDSIREHPSSAGAKIPLPDALVLESLINVFVSHRRMDLVRTYIISATTNGVYLTAYIANLLIKGYASIDDMESAREIFERLADPPAGIAAPYNHGDHGNHVPQKPYASSNGAYIYREPSTWEAMLRAELGSGNREKALELLERLKSRQYPAAVCNRISNIMFGDGAMPWNSLDSTPSSNDSFLSSPSFGANSANTSNLTSPSSSSPEETAKFSA